MTETAHWRSVVTLTVIAVLCAGLVAAVRAISVERIDANIAERRLARYSAVLADLRYDSIDLEPALVIAGTSEDTALGIRGVYFDEALRGMLIETTSVGYAGPIRLLIGIDTDRRILGVRVLSHKETPGLGDYIDERRSPWIHQFAVHAYANAERWQLRAVGGEFDGMTGATVTARAVVRGIGAALAGLNGIDKLGEKLRSGRNP